MKKDAADEIKVQPNDICVYDLMNCPITKIQFKRDVTNTLEKARHLGERDTKTKWHSEERALEILND